MPELPSDFADRERFKNEWQRNFAVSANAGSGKTTAISERLAAMALDSEASSLLARTAVVTYTKKAARQIGQRARSVLMRRLKERGQRDLNPLDLLERAFFGTIHAFCLNLAQRHGHTSGLHLSPEVVEADDSRVWNAFIEADSYEFPTLEAGQVNRFLRHATLDSIYGVAQQLTRSQAEGLLARAVPPSPPVLSERILGEIGKLKGRSNTQARLAANQERVRLWAEAYANGAAYIAFPKVEGTAGGIDTWVDELVAPVKQWVADVGGVMAATLAERYRAYRRRAGIQTYADQTDLALSVLKDSVVLDRIRDEGWRVILDEAQDTDPAQFSILVEIARPAGAELYAWPDARKPAVGPRPGHFCMVGDGQQAIYGNRADVGNFLRHLAAFERGDGGECLRFRVTFRAPEALIDFLNAKLPDAFGETRPHNLGLPPSAGAPAPYLQVRYQELRPRPGVEAGRVSRLDLVIPGDDPGGVDGWLMAEAEQVAERLLAGGPASVGAGTWEDVCLIAPRNQWLTTIADVFVRKGFKVALQQKKNLNATNPVYAWLTGLVSVACEPEDAFEWTGVLREVFGVSDDVIATRLRTAGRFAWDEPETSGAVLGGPLEALRPFILGADDEGLVLGEYLQRLATACGLEERCALLDPSGGLGADLRRLLAKATALGLEGGTLREFLKQLRLGLDRVRPPAPEEAGAIHLITAHSAKGLEWPVVIPMGLWRPLLPPPKSGFQYIQRTGDEGRLFFSASEMPAEMADSQLRETWRETLRLLYVVFTRPEQHLVLPWATGFGGPLKGTQVSFASLWGDTSDWHALPSLETPAKPPEVGIQKSTTEAALHVEAPWSPASTAVALPQRLLPHQLAEKPADESRIARSYAEREGSQRVADDAIAYGLWWHETLEFFPWCEAGEGVQAYLSQRYAAADLAGHGGRAREEIARWLDSRARIELSDTRWQRQAELGVFAPLREGAWIDGVMDLVLRDSVTCEVRIVDWKTNRRRTAETDAELGARIVAEYTPQLQAYGTALRTLFPADRISLWLYPTALGELVEAPFERPPE